MATKKSTNRSGAERAVESLLARVGELEARIARLEAARDAAVSSLVAAPPGAERPAAPVPALPAPPAAPPREAIGEEILMVIAASVAAFLGERAHVRQVRLVASEAWAQQGRVSVMASHRWAVHR